MFACLFIESLMDAWAICFNYVNHCRYNLYVFPATSKCSKVLTNAHTWHAHAAVNGVSNSFFYVFVKENEKNSAYEWSDSR